MIKELSKNIVEEVNKKLDEIYNHRKKKEGLVSCHNMLISSLRRHIDVWYEEQIRYDKELDKIPKMFTKSTNKEGGLR